MHGLPRYRAGPDLSQVKIPKRREVYEIKDQGAWGDFYGNAYAAAPVSLTTSRDFLDNTGAIGMSNSGFIIYPNGGVFVIIGPEEGAVSTYTPPANNVISLSTQLPGMKDKPHCFGELVQRDDATAGYYQYITATEGTVKIEVRDNSNHFLVSTPLEMSTEKFNAGSSVDWKRKVNFASKKKAFSDSGTNTVIIGSSTAFVGNLSKLTFEVARFTNYTQESTLKRTDAIPRELYQQSENLYYDLRNWLKMCWLSERIVLTKGELHDAAMRLASYRSLPPITAGWIVEDVSETWAPSYGVKFGGMVDW